MNTQVVFCHHCGHPNPADNQFCNQCGTHLVADQPTPPSPSRPTAPPPMPQPPVQQPYPYPPQQQPYPYPPQQPMPYPPPMPPRRQRSGWLTCGIIAAVLIVIGLCIIAIGILVGGWFLGDPLLEILLG